VFYEATVWGQLAEHVADTVHRGDRLLVHGSTHDEEWTDREGGTRIKHVIQVSGVGVSLRYATATVHRAAKTSPESQSEAEPVEASA
jgi:single-strand DNA-binding protein